MLEGVIDLIASEEEEVGIDLSDVIEDVLARNIAAVTWLDGVASEGGQDDFVFIDRVLANGAFVSGFSAMRDAIAVGLGVVPTLDAEWCGPAGFDCCRLGYFDPLTVLLNLQADDLGIIFG